MEFVSRYVAHKPQADGYVAYTQEEHRIWSLLFTRQMAIVPKTATKEFLNGLARLAIQQDTIPQIPAINHCLKQFTGWQVSAVDALISARHFFELLATKHFPVATFIRTFEELNYVKEPDVFHEVFGHCPMLTEQVYADFLEAYAKKVLSFPESDWPLLQRLFWFTVEFGLKMTSDGLKSYGGGILSSISETSYAIESDIPMRVLFDPVVAFRTPYRIDELQKVYFVIHSYEQLYQFVQSDITYYLERAKSLGEFPPLFNVETNNPNIHILAC
jgi:phenylalanine-4-hydroxylase